VYSGGAVAVFRNIEQELEMEQRLIETEKMASLGGMVAGVAHEVNTPVGVGVTAITYISDETKNFQQAFAAGGLTKQSLSDYLDTMIESSEIAESNLGRAAKLIRDFKKVAVNQSITQCDTFLLKPHIEELLHSLQPRLKHRPLEVKLHCSDTLSIESDSGALTQILVNLIENSLIHAFEEDESGTLSIEVEELPHSGTQQKIRLSYRDDGRGMTEVVRQHIFEPFFTTCRGKGGSGLGMQIVYNLVVHRLQGTIQVESAEEQGAHFLIALPAVMQDQPDTTVERSN